MYSLLIQQDDVDVLVVDSTRVHAEAMVGAVLSKQILFR